MIYPKKVTSSQVQNAIADTWKGNEEIFLRLMGDTELKKGEIEEIGVMSRFDSA